MACPPISRFLTIFALVAVAFPASPAAAQGRKKLDRALQQAIESSVGSGKQKVIIRHSACGTTIAGQPHLWAQNIIWGHTVVRGDPVYYNVPAWAQNTVWGEAATIVRGKSLNPGDNIVWGDNTVWGDEIASGESREDNIAGGNAQDIVWDNNSVSGNALAVGHRTGRGRQ